MFETNLAAPRYADPPTDSRIIDSVTNERGSVCGLVSREQHAYDEDGKESK